MVSLLDDSWTSRETLPSTNPAPSHRQQPMCVRISPGSPAHPVQPYYIIGWFCAVYAHMIHSQWMAHVLTTLSSQIRSTLNRWVIARGAYARSTEMFLDIVNNDRDEMFRTYLPWTYANKKQVASICNHFECGWINLPRQIETPPQPIAVVQVSDK